MKLTREEIENLLGAAERNTEKVIENRECSIADAKAVGLAVNCLIKVVRDFLLEEE